MRTLMRAKMVASGEHLSTNVTAIRLQPCMQAHVPEIVENAVIKTSKMNILLCSTDLFIMPITIQKYVYNL